MLFVAWLAFSRFRIVIASRDKTMPSVFAALDRTFRLFGGVPTYILTDNEKTVTVEHVAGIPVRNHQIVAFARHYSTSLQTCTCRRTRPRRTLETACEAFMDEVNSRVHRATLEIP